MTPEDTRTATGPSVAMTACTKAVRDLDHALYTFASLIQPGDSPLAMTRDQAAALMDVLSNSSATVAAYRAMLEAMLDYAENAGWADKPCH